LICIFGELIGVPGTPTDQNWNMGFPEEADVAEGNRTALVALLELLLGCAVHCAEKEQYVTKLMSLEQEVKGDLMGCIQELVVRGEGHARDSISTDAGDLEGYTPSQVGLLPPPPSVTMPEYLAFFVDWAGSSQHTIPIPIFLGV
jgi:hypothetical protein